MKEPCNSNSPPICANLLNLRNLRPICRRGFTFTEVMFAVILLGIGFIMLAGMFPVAIQQTQTNVEESTASTVAQAAAQYMEGKLTVDDVPPTGNLDNSGGKTIYYPRFLRLSERCYLNDNAPNNANGNKNGEFIPSSNPLSYILWDKLSGGFILPQDPRFAWTALYKRNPGDNFAQVIIFALQARNYSTYAPIDTLQLPLANSSPNLALAAIEPRFLPAILSDGGVPGEPDLIEFPANSNNEKLLRTAVAEGCFVVVSDDRVGIDDGNTPWFDPGYANGRIYRIGTRRADLDGNNSIVNNPTSEVWELMPGHDMQSPEENLPLRRPPHGKPVTPPNYQDHQDATPAMVFIIGRGFTETQSTITPPDTTFTGFAQDIAVYTTFIRLK